MAVFNLREIPDELAQAVRVEAAKRAMTLPAWVIETVKLRLKQPLTSLDEVRARVKKAKETKKTAKHDTEHCRLYKCGTCKALGVKNKNRGL